MKDERLPMTEKTLAQALKEEEEALRRRFIHHTRPKRPLTMEEAAALAASVSNGMRSDG